MTVCLSGNTSFPRDGVITIHYGQGDTTSLSTRKCAIVHGTVIEASNEVAGVARLEISYQVAPGYVPPPNS